MAFDAGSIISTLEVDRTPFQTGLRAARKEGSDFSRERYTATADLNDDLVKAKLAALRTALQQLTGRSLDVDLKIEAALAKIDVLQARLDGIHVPDLRIDIDMGDASTQIAALQAELDALHGNVDVDTDGIAAAMAELAALRAELDRVNGARARVDVDASSATRAAGQVGGLSGMITGLLTLLPLVVPVAGAAAGAIAAIGTGAALGVGGIGAIMLGISGIGDAYKALGEQSKSAGKSAAAAGAAQQSAASATAAAAQQMASAERGLASARENAADASARAAKQVLDARREAEQGVSQALDRQKTAERAYTAAVDDAKRAQAGLTAAREDARRSLEDLNFSTLGGALAERRAVLQLQDAQDALNAARARGATGRELEDVTLSYQEAGLALDELRVKNQRLAQDKDAADKAGIEGSKQVVAVNDQIAAANQRVADADKARSAAAAAVTEAQRVGSERMAEALANQERTARQNQASIASALDAVASANRAAEAASVRAGAAGVDSADKVKEALGALTPEGQRFVRFLDSQFRPALKGLKDEAQSNLLPGLQSGLEAAMPVLPKVSDLIGNLAFNIGTLGERAGKDLNGPFWRQYVDFLRQEAGPTTQTFGTIFGNTMKGIAGISQGAVPIWHQMGDGLEAMTNRLAAFGIEAASGKNQKFNDFLAYVERTGPRVVGLVGDLTTMVIDLGTALAPAGDLVLGFVDGVAQFIHAIPAPLLTGIATAAWAVAAGFAALGPVRIVIGLAAIAVGGLATAIVTLGTSIGSAGLVGFAGRLASLASFMVGPWGIAIGLATTALGFLWVAHQNADDAAKKQAESEKNFRDALVASKGAIDDNVRSTIQKSIADQTLATSGDALLTVTDALGISQTTLTDAIANGGKPLDDIRAKLQATADAGTRFAQSNTGGIGDPETHKVFTDNAQGAVDALSAIDGLTAGFAKQRDESILIRAAINGITVEQQKLRDATNQANDALLASIGADLTKEQTSQRLESAQKRVNDAIGQYGAGSLEARQAATDLDQTYLSLITQTGEAAAKQASMNGVVDTTQIALDAQNKKALELASTLTGPMPESLARVIGGMDATSLAAAGATIKIDGTGNAVIALPGGKDIKLTDNAPETVAHLKEVQKYMDELRNYQSIELQLNTPGAYVSRGAYEQHQAGPPKPPGGAGGGLVGFGSAVALRMARGGVIGGYAPGVDSVPAVLSRGESVLVPELTRAIGPRNILAANKAYSGRQPTMWSGGGVAHFAAGGVAGVPAAASSSGTLASVAMAALVDPKTTADAADAVDELTTATEALIPQINAAADAGTLQQATAQKLVAGGLDPLAAQLTGVTFPALTEAARLAGTVDVDALTALQAAHPPTQVAFQTTADTVARTMAASTSSIQAWQGQTAAAVGGVQSSLAVARDAMTFTADWGRSRFQDLQTAAADPIRWIMNGPLGDPGLVGAWNSLDAQFALNKHITAFRPGFAEGGPIRGAGTGTSDSIPAMLSDGEFVVRAAVAQRVPHFLDALNDGQAEAVQAAGGGGGRMPGYADGGPVGEAVNRTRKIALAMNGKPYIWGGASMFGADCSGFQSILTNSLRGDANPYHRIGTTDTFPWPGFAPGLGGAYSVGAFKGDPGHMASTLAGTNAEAGGSPSRVKFGTGAAGADSSQFTTRAFLPAIGGKFVSGGMGGEGFDVAPMVADAFADTRAQIAQIPGLFGVGMPASTGQAIAGQAVDAAQNTGVGLLNTMFASTGGGGNVEQYRGVVNQALTMLGLPLSNADRTLRRMDQESAGNATAVNRWDINWLNGTPSVGLMQVIGPTYRANRDPRADTGPYLYGVSTNPLANVLASMKYGIGRYGNLASAYDRAGGYDNGGEIPPGRTLVDNRSGKFENVLNAEQGHALADRIRGGDGADIEVLVAQLADAIERMDRIQIDVHPREDQSEESIGAVVERRLTKRRRTL